MKINKKFALLISFFALIITGCVPDKFVFEKEIIQTSSKTEQYLGATDLDVTSKGYLVIADSGNKRFQIISPDNNSIFLASDNESVLSKFKLKSLTGLGINSLSDDVYLCDNLGSKIVKYSFIDGKPILKIDKNVNRPIDVAIDKSENIYAIMKSDSKIYKYDSNGKFLGTIGGNGKAVMIQPMSICFSKDYNFIYVADYGGKRIVKLSKTGEFVSEITSKGEEENLKGPKRVYVDNEDNVYVIDLGSVPVVVFDKEGKLVSKIGTVGQNNEKGEITYPIGIVAKNSSEVYILDNVKNSIFYFKRKKEDQ